MKSISLRSLLLFGIAAIQVVGAAVFLVTFFSFANRAADDHARSNLGWALTSVQQEVVNFFTNAELAVNSAIRLSQTPLLGADDPTQVRRYFFETLESDPQLTGAFQATGRGDFVFVTRESASLEPGEYFARIITVRPDGRDHRDVILRAGAAPRDAPNADISGFLVRDRPWFAPALAGDGFAWTDAYIFFLSGQPGITIARRVPGTEGDNANIFGADLSLLGISTFIDSLSLSPGGRVFVVHPNGQMIAFPGYSEQVETSRPSIPHFSDHPDPAIRMAFEESGLFDKPLPSNPSAEFTFDMDGQKYFAAFRPFNVSNVTWTMGAIAPSRDFIGWFDDVRMATLVLVLVLSALSMVGGWLVWHRVDRSLEAIRRRSLLFLDHDAKTFEAETSGIRELADTESALATMATEIEKRAQQNRQITERLAAIVTAVDHAPVAIAIFDPSGEVAYMNPLIPEFLDFAPPSKNPDSAHVSEDLITAVDALLSNSAPNGAPAIRLSEAIASDAVWEGQLVRTSRTQAVSGYYAIAAPMHDFDAPPNGPALHAPWFLVIEDATKRHEAEQALIAAVQHAEELSSAKSRFLAGMSHELRTPLNSILGYSEILLHDSYRPTEEERQREYADSIHQSGRILLGILTNILDMTAIETGRLSLNPKDILLHETVANAVYAESARCEAAGISVEVNVPDDLRVYADAFKLERVIANLLQNSAKYAGAGSRVTIEATITSDDCVDIIVEDDGVGIRSSELETVMEPFRRLSGDVNIALSDGVGLGLPLARSIIRLHGGKLELSSGRSGKGLRITISLPRHPDTSPA